MIWLAGKIFAYLLIALVTGGLAGWLLGRVLQKRRWQDQLAVVRAELFRMENRAAALQAEASSVKARIVELEQVEHKPQKTDSAPPQEAPASEVRKLNALLLERDQRLVAAELSAAAGDNLVAALHREIIRLKTELADLPPSKADAGRLELTVRDLEGRLVRKMSEIDRLEQTLQAETRKITELERERDLQDKSLRVLHQQLEMERQPKRIAS